MNKSEYNKFLNSLYNLQDIKYKEFYSKLGINGNNMIGIRVPILKKIAAIREVRSKSTKEATRKQADIPALFTEIRQPDTNYIVIPKVSSENRRYIPLGFLSPDVICNNTIKFVPNATLFHFGVLCSNVHNAWMRAVAGRLKSDYQYSNTIVYN